MEERKLFKLSITRKTQWSCLGLAAAMGVGLFLLPASVVAMATGPCVDCHTMHNSQDNAVMTFDGLGPYEMLLRGGCIACHTSLTGVANDGTNSIPYVNSIDPPVYGTDGTGATSNTLAGGNFYWVSTAGGATDAKGHNVTLELLAAAGAMDANPPGIDAANSTYPAAGGLTCAGITGCHGDRTATDDYTALSGAHHADDSVIDGTTVPRSYRFLLGVTGFEDADWEYRPDASNHNQYKGIDRADDTAANDDPLTVSSLCAQCHNDFHNGAGNPVQGVDGGFGNPWIRHPSDFDMGNTAAGSEYKDYGGAGTNAYLVSAPVASTDVTAVLSSVALTASDEAIVTCISCHRAHGSPFDDLLRWDYDPATTSIVSGGLGSGGCLLCHTTK